MLRHLKTLTMLGAVLALGLTAPTADAQVLKGKTITVMIGYSAGGSTDTYSRIFAPYWEKHTKGNPKFIIKSMPGAGGMKVLNWLTAKAPKDGLTIMIGPTLTISQVLGQKGARFDYTKFTTLGGFISNSLLTYVRNDAVPGGLKKRSDILKVKAVKQAGLRATAWYDLTTRLALDILGIKNTYVPGYRGGAKIRAAIRQGEATIGGIPMGGFRSGAEPTMGDIVTALWYFPFVDQNGKFVADPSAKEIPSFIDFHKQVKGALPSGPKWEYLKFILNLRSNGSTNIVAGPPGMNKEAAAVLRKGLLATFRDKEAQAKYEKVLGNPLNPLTVARIGKGLASMQNADKALVKQLTDYAYGR